MRGVEREANVNSAFRSRGISGDLPTLNVAKTGLSILCQRVLKTVNLTERNEL